MKTPTRVYVVEFRNVAANRWITATHADGSTAAFDRHADAIKETHLRKASFTHLVYRVTRYDSTRGK